MKQNNTVSFLILENGKWHPFQHLFCDQANHNVFAPKEKRLRKREREKERERKRESKTEREERERDLETRRDQKRDKRGESEHIQ